MIGSGASASRGAASLLEVAALTKHYPVRGGVFGRTRAQVHAVDEVSFGIAEGETLGLVGESGCGKSTLGKTVLRLVPPTSGTISWRGSRIDGLDAGAMRAFRRELQAVFQDPYASLNPRMRAEDIVAEPIRNFEDKPASEIRGRVRALFEQVGLRADQMRKYPYEFSGGQRQRLGIARALAPKPKLIVCDEPVSALDVSVQAQVINLLVPDPAARRKRLILAGDVPSPIKPPPGCRFHTRCPYAFDRCRVEEPVLKEPAPGHLVACHLREAVIAPPSAWQRPSREGKE